MKLFKWLNEYLRWKMFQWIWGLDNNQASYLKRRIEEDEPKMKEKKWMSVYGEVKEVTMEIPNPMFN